MEKSSQSETISIGQGGAPPSQVPSQGRELQANLRQQALAEARHGNHADAIALFSKLLEQNPHSATDYNNRGLVYFQCRQLEQAIADYNRAIELNPNLDSVYNNRANYYAHQGQLLQAILDYDAAIDLNPQNVRAWINQGITFRDLQMHDRALECFDAALNFGRLEGHIYAERGRTYHLRGDWNCAIADYYRAMNSLPTVEDPGNARSMRLRQQVGGWLNELLSPLGN
ncbi:MAG: tetratricopeptide repeat protein [Synechococcales bacterium]|nr:tetratricopeptide repeat protein [Synechococcales bacterium]